MPRQTDSIEDWSFDSHDRQRATDLDTGYDSPIHNWDAQAQRELEGEPMNGQNTQRGNGVERTTTAAPTR